MKDFELNRDMLAEFLESAEEKARMLRMRRIVEKVEGKRRAKLKLAENVECHPFWWALPPKENPNLRLVRAA